MILDTTFIGKCICHVICNIPLVLNFCKQHLPEKKLPVEVGDINSVHVNNMNKAKPRQSLKHNKTMLGIFLA